MLRFAQYAFVDHRVDPFDEVDGLRDVEVRREAGQSISLISRDGCERDDPIDHLVQRPTRGIVEISIETEGDEVRRGFCAREAPAQILAHVKLEGAGERRLYGRAVHFTVALGGVPVAGREQRAFVPYGQVDRAAGGELLAIDVATEFAGSLLFWRPKSFGGATPS